MEIKINENSIFVNGEEYIKKQEQPTPKPLKRGDLVIAWDFDDEENAIIGIYKGKRDGLCVVGDVSMGNAIPFESIKQYKEFIKG